MTSNIVTLFCLIDGATPSHAFPVKIPSNDTIGDLKGLIVSGVQAPEFKDIAAMKLTLWRVDYPINLANKHDPVPLKTFSSPTELDPFDNVSQVFKETPPARQFTSLSNDRHQFMCVSLLKALVQIFLLQTLFQMVLVLTISMLKLKPSWTSSLRQNQL